jgi:coenzyme Q-binding protein COQ10|tara:strand:+ start:563 stop:1012 length:450 start_codon:yes stop_codon:yes gene_type:complete
MPSASIKKKISCTKENLIKMVLDIEKYPEFVPWCLRSKIHSKKDKGNKVEIIADLTIGKSFFNETYKSFVIYEKEKDLIYVNNIDGPLKYLENKWFFRQKGKNSEVDFHVDFELKNKILNMFMTKSFDIGLKKIANAFEERAVKLFQGV